MQNQPGIKGNIGKTYHNKPVLQMLVVIIISYSFHAAILHLELHISKDNLDLEKCIQKTGIGTFMHSLNVFFSLLSNR